MAVSSLVAATSSGGSLTPFDAPFSYTFGTMQTGQIVELNLTASIPAGTYTIKGGAGQKGRPHRLKLLTSNGTIVGTANLSLLADEGAGSYNNNESYQGEVTASAAFSKVQFFGSTTGGQVLFNTGTFGTQTGGYHFTLSSGTRTATKTNYIEKLATDPTVTTYSNHPTTGPGDNYLCGWFWNGNFYVLTQVYAGTPVAGQLNSVKAWKWNYSNSTWTQVGATRAVTTAGDVDITTYQPGTSTYWDIYIFKNGKVALKPSRAIVNTSGQYRVSSGWYYVDMVANTLTGTSSANNSTAELCHAAAAYNPTNDEWYINARPIYNTLNGTYTNTSALIKLTNTLSISSSLNSFNGTIGSSEDACILYCENAANPKLYATHSEYNNSSNIQFYAYSAFGSAHSNTSSSGWNSTSYYPNLAYMSRSKSVTTNLYGNTNQILTVQHSSTTLKAIVTSGFTFPTTATAFSDIPYATSYPMGDAATLWHGGASNSVLASIQPINTTEYGIVVYSREPVAGQQWSVKTIPLPNSVTL